jgi:hypothetical protein
MEVMFLIILNPKHHIGAGIYRTVATTIVITTNLYYRLTPRVVYSGSMQGVMLHVVRRITIAEKAVPASVT